MRAVLHYDRFNGLIVCRTPFKRQFVEQLKDEIPSSARVWDADAKTWEIDIEWDDVLIPLVRRHYSDVVIEDDAPSPPARHADVYAVLYLLPGAPPELVDSAYRTLARITHPDVNRSPDATEAMKRINTAYERLKAGAA